jgi:hypothetical protein
VSRTRRAPPIRRSAIGAGGARDAPASITVHLHETMKGHVTVDRTIPSTDWAWASCTDWAHQTPSDTAICLKDGYDPNLLYQVRFVAKDPYLLGSGSPPSATSAPSSSTSGRTITATRIR